MLLPTEKRLAAQTAIPVPEADTQLQYGNSNKLYSNISQIDTGTYQNTYLKNVYQQPTNSGVTNNVICQPF